MGNCCDCCGHRTIDSKERASLKKAQTMTKTIGGKPVNPQIRQFYTREYLQNLKLKAMKKDHEWIDIFSTPMNDFTKITENLYLTGIGGLSLENIRDKHIKCVINVTYELPKFVAEGIESLRIPVEDSVEDLSPYFKDIASKLEENNKKGIKTVIFCLTGISRSPTLVMAYLMKKKNRILREAFTDVITKRPIVRPNRHFLNLLIAYEKKVHRINYNHFKYVCITGSNGKSIPVPDFTVQYYLVANGSSESDSVDDHIEAIDQKLSDKFKDLTIG